MGVKGLSAGVLALSYHINLHMRNEGFRKTDKNLRLNKVMHNFVCLKYPNDSGVIVRSKNIASTIAKSKTH